MRSRTDQRALRVLRSGLQLLTGALLALVAVRAAAVAEPDRGAVVAVAAAIGVAALAGSALPGLRRSRARATTWLALLSALWAVLLALTPDGVWLAFPLFLLQLHLLPLRWGLAAVAATTAVAVAGYALHQPEFTAAAAIGPVLGAIVSIATVLGYQALYRESERRRLLIEELTATRGELAAAEHAAGVATERERLAREIHDTIAQGLSSILLLLRAAERALPQEPETAAGHVARARRVAQDDLAEARRFVFELTPPALEQASLSAALERLCTTTAERTGLPVELHLSGRPEPLATAAEVALLRIAQSALANAVRHARASRVALTLSWMDRKVVLDVVDDGAGFDPSALPAGGPDGGFGLGAMRARAAALGGTLTVESAPGEGTAVAASFPLGGAVAGGGGGAGIDPTPRVEAAA